MTIKSYENDYNETVGIKFPLNGNASKSRSGFFNTSQTTEEQAITNYVNLLMTKPGERYYHPKYGIGIQLYLFEQNTEQTRQEIEFVIRSQCNYWLPYIVNHKIDVRDKAELLGLNSDPENAIHIVITFSASEQGANKTITIFQRGGNVVANVE